MTIRDFIRANRSDIDAHINRVLYRYDGSGNPGTIPNPPPTRNDTEREQWIMNDEGLYNWWMSERHNPPPKAAPGRGNIFNSRPLY